jgi:hypothetical protein
MSSPLSPDSFMECPVHGRSKPAFICQYLQHGTGLGVFIPAEPPTEDDPWQQAWCAKCEAVAVELGEWNDESEAFASFRWVCEGCFVDSRMRNE